MVAKKSHVTQLPLNGFNAPGGSNPGTRGNRTPRRNGSQFGKSGFAVVMVADAPTGRKETRLPGLKYRNRRDKIAQVPNPKCKGKFCRRNAHPRKGGLCSRCHQRKWRAEHPIADAWQVHKWNAKQRGIPVEWTRDEFAEFCERTGYDQLRKDGMTIQRDDCLRGYSLANCPGLLPHGENSQIGATFDRRRKRRFYESKNGQSSLDVSESESDYPF